jgi:hypothetical protein
MAFSPVLHPSVRVRDEPRVSAAALAEYLIFGPSGQQNILHDSKYSRTSIVAANGEAMRALRTYNNDLRRSLDTLLRVKDALTIKSRTVGIRPKAKDEALRCLELIDMFERNENALGLRSMALSAPPKFEAINIEGVMVSIRPDFIVGGGGRNLVGAGSLRVAKAPDPAAGKRPETRAKRGEIRREMARYMVAMQQILLDAQGGSLGIPSQDLCFVADVRLGERIGPAPDHAVRLRDIRAACKQIASLWESITPKPALFKKS